MVKMDDSVMIAVTKEYVVTIALVLIISYGLLSIDYWLFVICHLSFMCLCIHVFIFLPQLLC